MRKDGFTVCAKHYIKCLRQEGRYATAHVYESALRSFTMFCGTAGVSFRQITRGNLKRYSSYLMDCHLRLNTISTYMRMLRCIYNRGVDMHQTPYVHRMFRDVFTGIDTRQKKAIPINELHTLLNEDPQSDKLRRTQAIANLLFLVTLYNLIQRCCCIQIVNKIYNLVWTNNKLLFILNPVYLILRINKYTWCQKHTLEIFTFIFFSKLL